MRRPFGSTANAIRALLRDFGPMTRIELQREVGIPRDRVSAVVSRIHTRGEIHIQSYTYDDESGRRYPRAIYAWGPGENAAKPKADKKEVGRRSKRVTRTRIMTSSVFNLGLTRQQCRDLRRVVIGDRG